MIGHISSGCSSEAHVVASFGFSCQAQNSTFCEPKCLGKTREVKKLPRFTALQIKKVNSKFFCGKSWRSASPENLGVISDVRPGLERVSLPARHRPQNFPVSSTQLNRRLSTALANSISKSQMSFFGDVPDVEQRIPAAGGENAAMEASYGPSPGQADTLNSIDHDAAKATSLPGILCPPVTTVGKSTNIVWQECMVKREERQKLLGQKACVIWITGLSGSGKSTLACTLNHTLLNTGKLSYVLDGDNLRHGLNNNLGFSAEDRAENIRRIGEVAKLFVDAGVICIASCISPYRKDRDACRKLLKPGEFIEVYMNFPLDLCEERDPKGLYKLAREGKIKGFTGVDDPYEPPLNCEVVMELVDGKCPTPTEMAAQLISYLEDRRFLGPHL